jgi:hypothetical protein
MTINGNYPSPVTVNGFSCMNCTDVDRANKFVDPAHPQDGPKPEGPKGADTDQQKVTFNDPAVILGGTLADPNAVTSPSPASDTQSVASAVSAASSASHNNGTGTVDFYA